MKLVEAPATKSTVLLATLKPGDVFTNYQPGRSYSDSPCLVILAPQCKVGQGYVAVLRLVDSALTSQSKDTEVYLYPNASYYL